MLYNAKNKTITIDNSTMDYVSFGKGGKVLVVLPGLSDGLATVKGKALLLARSYKQFFKEYTVYMFSRKNNMSEGYSIKDMAGDLAKALDILNISSISLLGVSEGGMIAISLAIYHPHLIDKLIIAFSSPTTNNTINKNINTWLTYTAQDNHSKLMIDVAEHSYSPNYLKKYRNLYPFLKYIGKPSSYNRFNINANAILNFNEKDNIQSISCPTLIIGAKLDEIVGVEASYELAKNIKDSELYIYPNLGHAAYEEASDFYERIYNYLEKD